MSRGSIGYFSRLFLSVLLAIALSLSLAFPCYAYADVSAQVTEVGDAATQENGEGADSGGDASGTSHEPSQIESISSISDDGAAGEGHVRDDEAADQAEEDFEEDNGGVTYYDDPSNSPDDSFGGFAGDDYLSSDDVGIMPLGLTEVGYLDKIYFALGANSGQGSETFRPYSVSWSAIKGTINWVASKIYINVAAIAEDFIRANNYLQAIDTATKYHRSEFQSAWGYGYGGTAVFNTNSPAGWLQKIRDYNVNEYYDGYTYSTAKYLAFIFREAEQAETLSKQQWGYNYGTGNTVVFSTNSPAGWLQKIRDYNVNEYYDGYTYSTAKYLAFIFREMERANSKLNYNGSLTGGDTGDYSAARLLARVHNTLYGDITYAETGNGGVRSAVSVLGYLANLVYYGNRDASSLLARNTYQGGLVGVDGSDTYGTARLLARIHNALYGEVTLHETGGTSVRSAVGLIGYLSNLVYDTQYSTGELVETGTAGKRSLADLVRYSANVAYLIKEKLDNLTVDVRGGISADVDLGYIEARLDTIADLMRIGAAKDVVDAIVGDLDATASAALMSEVSSAASRAFPFCVPALVKEFFGLVSADASPPVLDFDIAGQSLHIDASPMEGFADLLRWACRFLYCFVLLVSSRRFIYTGVAS